MSRLMSVAMTEQAVIERRKTVTRRLGWTFLEPGVRLTLVRKAMGRVRRLPDGTRHVEPLVRLAEVEVVDVRRERLDALLTDLDYGDREVELEGFPGLSPVAFLARYFVGAQGCDPTDEVTRIEWRYLDNEQEDARG